MAKLRFLFPTIMVIILLSSCSTATSNDISVPCGNAIRLVQDITQSTIFLSDSNTTGTPQELEKLKKLVSKFKLDYDKTPAPCADEALYVWKAIKVSMQDLDDSINSKTGESETGYIIHAFILNQEVSDIFKEYGITE